MKVLILSLAALCLTGCADNIKPISQNSNTANAPAEAEKTQTAIAHGPQNQTPPPAGGTSKWTQSGDPIDTTKFDAAIITAEKALAAKPADATAKQALAAAFLERATALTGARQYASALGDYRRTLKNDPANKEAKTWIDQIVNIYASINRASPKDGEEPPPLPFTKST